MGMALTWTLRKGPARRGRPLSGLISNFWTFRGRRFFRREAVKSLRPLLRRQKPCPKTKIHLKDERNNTNLLVRIFETFKKPKKQKPQNPLERFPKSKVPHTFKKTYFVFLGFLIFCFFLNFWIFETFKVSKIQQQNKQTTLKRFPKPKLSKIQKIQTRLKRFSKSKVSKPF